MPFRAKPLQISEEEHDELRQITLSRSAEAAHQGLVERAMEAELTTHLGYEKHDPVGYGSGNSRNGKSKKRLKGDFGEVEIEVPGDRESSFEPRIVPKGKRVSPVLMTRFCLSTRGASARVKSKGTCRRFMESKSVLR
jgi:transposase-like protein